MFKDVLAVGVFDIFHYGHLRHLKAASEMGILNVGITIDKQVKKGKGRPLFNEDQRSEIVGALSFVNKVFLVESSIQALQTLPDIFVLGKEYRGKVRPEDVEFCQKHRIQICFTNGPVYSSTKILNDRLRQG